MCRRKGPVPGPDRTAAALWPHWPSAQPPRPGARVLSRHTSFPQLFSLLLHRLPSSSLYTTPNPRKNSLMSCSDVKLSINCRRCSLAREHSQKCLVLILSDAGAG